MDQLKRFIECYIETETCNLRCHYCYIAQKRLFNNKLASFSHPLEEMKKALSVERLGGVCLFNLCAGGETLLSPEVLPLAKALIEEGHYISLITNGTLTKRFEEIASWPNEIKSHLFLKMSFHYLELKRLDWFDRYFANVELMKNSGVSLTVELTPSDELIPYIDEVKSLCMERLGALCQVTIARDDRTAGIDVLSERSFEEYQKIWGIFKSPLFEFKKTIFYQKRKEFCYAGDWSINLSLSTGEYGQCYCGKRLGNIYEDIDKPLKLEAIGTNCSLAHCYNGHAFLTLGLIPELQTPTYAEMRNRICTDGTEWLQPEVKSLFGQRLKDDNEEYSKKQKIQIRKNNKAQQTMKQRLIVKLPWLYQAYRKIRG